MLIPVLEVCRSPTSPGNLALLQPRVERFTASYMVFQWLAFGRILFKVKSDYKPMMDAYRRSRCEQFVFEDGR